MVQYRAVVLGGGITRLEQCAVIGFWAGRPLIRKIRLCFACPLEASV